MLFLIVMMFIIPFFVLLLLIIGRNAAKKQRQYTVLSVLLIFHLVLCLAGEIFLGYASRRNTQELSVAEQWRTYELVEGDMRVLPLNNYQQYSERPLLVEGIFDGNTGRSVEFIITTIGATTKTETIPYDSRKQLRIDLGGSPGTTAPALESPRYGVPIFQCNTKGITTIHIGFTTGDQLNTTPLTISVGREHNKNANVLKRNIPRVMLSVAIAGVISLFLLIIIFMLRSRQKEVHT